jgi:hypothetical protein
LVDRGVLGEEDAGVAIVGFGELDRLVRVVRDFPGAVALGIDVVLDGGDQGADELLTVLLKRDVEVALNVGVVQIVHREGRVVAPTPF